MSNKVQKPNYSVVVASVGATCVGFTAADLIYTGGMDLAQSLVFVLGGVMVYSSYKQANLYTMKTGQLLAGHTSLKKKVGMLQTMVMNYGQIVKEMAARVKTDYPDADFTIEEIVARVDEEGVHEVE